MAAARAPYGVKAKGLNERHTAPHPSLPHASCPVDHTCFRSPSSQSPLAEVLNLSGLGSTALRCDRAAVNDGTITNDEFTQILQTLKAGLPAEMCDPSSLGRYNFHTRHHPLSHPCTCPLSVLLIHPPSPLSQDTLVHSPPSRHGRARLPPARPLAGLARMAARLLTAGAGLVGLARAAGGQRGKRRGRLDSGGATGRPEL